MQEAKKSIKEKGIKAEDVKNLPPIEKLCEPTTHPPMVEVPLLEKRLLMAHHFVLVMAHIRCAITTTPLLSQVVMAHHIVHHYYLFRCATGNLFFKFF